MVAGATAMSMMTHDMFAYIDRLGAMARSALTEAFKFTGVVGKITGEGSLFYIHFTNRDFVDYRSTYRSQIDRKRVNVLLDRLLERGFILATTAMGCISTAMSESDIHALAEAFAASLREMQAEGIFDEKWGGP